MGVSGDVTVVPFSQSGSTANTVKFLAVPQGVFMPVAAAYIMSTGTTATNLVARTIDMFRAFC